MDTAASREIAGWLRAWKNGQPQALNKLIPLVYRELQRLARRHMREGGGGSLQTTSVVHEAYLRLVDLSDVSWQDRAHFFAVSSRIMQGILVDTARARRSQKRGGLVRYAGSSSGFDLDQIPDMGSGRTEEHLAQMDPRQAHVVEMRFFGGLSVEENPGDYLRWELGLMQRPYQVLLPACA